MFGSNQRKCFRIFTIYTRRYCISNKATTKSLKLNRSFEPYIVLQGIAVLRWSLYQSIAWVVINRAVSSVRFLNIHEILELEKDFFLKKKKKLCKLFDRILIEETCWMRSWSIVSPEIDCILYLCSAKLHVSTDPSSYQKHWKRTTVKSTVIDKQYSREKMQLFGLRKLNYLAHHFSMSFSNTALYCKP